MFTDGVRLELVAGKGGNGVIAWRREKYIPKGGPSGGNGGDGGSIIIRASRHFYSLDKYRNKRLIAAGDGKQGGSNKRHGANGKSLILDVPCGTLVKNPETGEVMRDMTEDGEEWEICKGGRGGRGNETFKTPTNRAPHKCTPGRPGTSCEIELELKLIADIGFVGFPNAGKSTLLSKITSKEVKIGNYPFTTLAPNLSYIQFEDFSRLYIADIPGIIKDAHKDRGLGLTFLRHIERSEVLVYVIDAAGTDVRDPFEDFTTLTNELESYSRDLINKPFVVVLNKVDRDESQAFVSKFRKKFHFDSSKLVLVSALNGEGLDTLIEKMRSIAQASGKRYE
ncbi:MAG: GTPase ObgE [Simkaniaceae bacterium]|nr:GTPase ObgE [Simkaniaceae bacterium]